MKSFHKYTHGATGITLYVVSKLVCGDSALLSVKLDDGTGNPAQDNILPLLSDDTVADIEMYIDLYLESIVHM